MTAGRIAAVTLDLDGTLYSIRRMVLRNWLVMLPVADFFRDLHVVRDQMRGLEPVEDFRGEQAARLASRRGITQAEAARMIERIIDDRWMKVFRRVKLYPGVQAVLRDLLERGLRLGLISDYPIKPKLEGMGLAGFPFGCIVNAEEVGALKPHPAPFQRAAADLGVEASAILHVGDREDCDVAGAIAAGMRAARFDRGRSGSDSRAEIIFTDWRKFMTLLEQRDLLAERES